MRSWTKSIYVLVLTSEKDNSKIKYHEWESKFKAYAVTKGFLSTLLSGYGLPKSYS